MIERVCAHPVDDGEVCHFYDLIIGGVRGEDILDRMFSVFIALMVAGSVIALVLLFPLLPIIAGVLFVLSWVSLKCPFNYRIVRTNQTGGNGG